MIHRRLVPLVDDTDRHQEHAGAEVHGARDEEIDIGLFQLDLARRLEPLDKRVLELQLRHKPDPIGEAVREQQHESMKVERRILVLHVVQVEIHVAGDRAGQRRLWCLG